VARFLAEVLFRFGIKRDQRKLEADKASVARFIEEHKTMTDFDRANRILARYEAEDDLSYDALREKRQQIVREMRQRSNQQDRAVLVGSRNKVGKSLWSTVLAVLMGDDDEDGPLCALICRFCALHNGYVGLLKYPGYRLLTCLSSAFWHLFIVVFGLIRICLQAMWQG